MRTYALVVLLLAQLTTASQNCSLTLSGKVIDLHDGSLLSGATLVVAETETVVQTSLDGVYSISNLCPNTSYSIKVLHSSCTPKTFALKISGHSVRDFKLEHHLEELNEIILEGKAYENKTTTVLEKNLNQETLEQYSAGTLGDALNSLSGVSSLNKGNGIVKPIINGLHSSRIIMINNGVRMQDQEWGKEHAPNIDVNSVGRLTLVKSASALQYGGDAMGGIIIAEGPKVAIKDSLYGKTMLFGASNGRGGGITSQLTKSFENGIYGTAQGTFKRFGDVEAADYVMSNTGLYEKDISLRIGLNRFNYGIEGYYSYYNTTIGILRSAHAANASSQIRAINSNEPLIIRNFTYDIGYPNQDVKHHLARIKGFKNFESLGKVNFQYDYQKNKRFEYDIRRGNDRDTPALDLELDTHTVLVDVKKAYDALELKYGIMGRFQTNFANPDTGIRRLIPDYDKYDYGVYVIGDYKINDKWQVESGIRFDYSFIDAFKYYKNSVWIERGYDLLFPDIVVNELSTQLLTNPKLEFNNLSATIGFNYNISEKSSLFFNQSMASRAPNPSELFSDGLHHAIARIELGDLRLKSEIGHKTDLTYRFENERFNFSVNPFHNLIQDFILIEPTGLRETIRGNFQVWEYRQTEVQLFGVDIDASYNLNKALKFTHQLSLVKGYERGNNMPLINMPPVNTKNQISYSNQKLNNLKLSLESEYVFAQNEYPDNNFEVYIPVLETTETLDISTPPNAYHLLKLNGSMDFKVSKTASLKVGLELTNLLNNSYRSYLNLLRYYADDLGRNFLLNLKLNY
ncbi:TonB-dependent receptor [Flavobacteriaceae bacterium]|nr:TonB-dependent receptor [Flavobacteriaceae bacterium]